MFLAVFCLVDLYNLPKPSSGLPLQMGTSYLFVWSHFQRYLAGGFKYIAGSRRPPSTWSIEKNTLGQARSQDWEIPRVKNKTLGVSPQWLYVPICSNGWLLDAFGVLWSYYSNRNLRISEIIAISNDSGIWCGVLSLRWWLHYTVDPSIYILYTKSPEVLQNMFYQLRWASHLRLSNRTAFLSPKQVQYPFGFDPTSQWGGRRMSCDRGPHGRATPQAIRRSRQRVPSEVHILWCWSG